ncbi:hypothetical protein [Brachybacterium sp. GPGPB12]|uniref:hypothetical protein n=1 Tax=Brachybacterium sp. GPGPB12 TaxID=3023517 RepID=UPI0031344967
MPQSALLLLAAAIGLVIGVVATSAPRRSESRRAEQPAARDEVVPEAAAEVLAILSSAYVVLDSVGDVLRASPMAYSYGIVRAAEGDYPRLASTRLMELASDVGRNGGFRDERLTVRRSAQGDTDAVIDVRIGALGEHGVLAAGRRPHSCGAGGGDAARLRRERVPRAEDPRRRDHAARRDDGGRR